MNTDAICKNILVLALFGLLWAGCGGEPEVSQTQEGRLVLGESEVTAEVTRGVVPGARTLVLDGFDGSVELTAAAGEAAALTFIKRARGDSDADAREMLEDVQIAEEGDEQTYRFSLQTDRPEQTSVDVRGAIPPQTALRIEMTSGSVSLSGVDGPIQVTNENGNVRIAGAGESVSVQTQAGAVDVGLRLLPARASVNLRTANGDVTLGLPAEASARIEAETQVGDIRVQGLDFTDRRLRPEGAGASFTGRLGAGNANVELHTQNGAITLQEGSTLALPPDSVEQGQPAEAIEEDLVPDRPRRPLDSLQRATPPLPDTSMIRAQPDTTFR